MKKIKSVGAALLAAMLLLSACGKPEEVVSVSDSTSSEVTASVSTEPETNDTEEAAKVTFDTSVTYQTMDGFGAAYTWYGDRLLNAKNSEEGLDALFSDAKLTILRFKNEYEYSVPGKASNAVAMARNYKEARERAAKYGEQIKVLLCCWSPPARLKSDDTIATGYGTLKKRDNGEYMYEEYAEWWVESVKYYEARGMKVDYVSIQNEIDFSPASYEGCRFAPRESEEYAAYSKAFIAVYDAFKEAFGEDAPILLGPETMGCNYASLIGYTKPITDERPEALGGLAFHLYATGTSNEDENTVKPSSYQLEFSKMKDMYKNYTKWQTEFFIGRGIQTAELIWTALTEANMNAYLYWSAVWDDSHPDRFESSDLVEINSKGEWRLTANYYVMKHYSSYIRPGYVRVDSKSENKAIKTCAFINENSSKTAMVLINTSDKDCKVAVLGADYTIKDAHAYQSVFGDMALSDADMFKDLGSISSDGMLVLPAKSVTTLDITGYAGNTPVNVPAVTPIVYDNEINTEVTGEPAPTSDKVMIDADFSKKSQVSVLSAFGSVNMQVVESKDKNGEDCLLATGRGGTWNGPSISDAYFDHYGYMVKLEYDCMTETDGLNLSCTSTFTINNIAHYPNIANNRVACSNMKAGKWYHCEGYVTLYSDMDPGSFRLYWETPDSQADFYLDNVKMTILYTQPAGTFPENAE